MAHGQIMLSRPLVLLRMAGKAVVWILALIGFLALLGKPLLTLMVGPSFDRRVLRTVSSPNGVSSAEIEVTTGFATVHTTRVNLRTAGEAGWTIYEAGDSEFEPPLRWIDAQTLVVGLPCGRFNLASNPDDWQRENPAARRLKVRFEYGKACQLAGPGP